MASSPLDTHLVGSLVPVLCPGAAVRHSGDPNAHGVVVSVVDGQATVLWSVVPRMFPQGTGRSTMRAQPPHLHSARWTDDQVDVAAREFGVDLLDPNIVDVDVRTTTHNGETTLIVHRVDPVDSFARSLHEGQLTGRISQQPHLVTSYHPRRC